MIMPSVLIDLCCSLFILNHPEVLMNLGNSELESNRRILRHLRLLFFSLELRLARLWNTMRQALGFLDTPTVSSMKKP